MKQTLCLFVFALATALTPKSALADANSARDWALLAHDLKNSAASAKRQADQSAMLGLTVVPSDLIKELPRFGLVASRLGSELDAYPDATDLSCIFRGMAEETDTQLKALKRAQSGVEQSAALSRLFLMLDDAVHLGEAAARVLETPPQSSDAPNIGQCEAANLN